MKRAGKKKTGKAIPKCFKERSAYWAGVRRDRALHKRVFELKVLDFMSWGFTGEYMRHIYELNKELRLHRGKYKD